MRSGVYVCVALFSASAALIPLAAFAAGGDGKIRAKIEVAAERPFGKAFLLPDGRRMVTTAGEKRYGVALWDAGTGAALWTLDAAGHVFLGGVFSPDGQRILIKRSTNYGREVRFQLVDARSGAVLSDFAGVSVHGARLSPDGRTVVTGDGNGRLELWDGRTGMRLRTLSENGAPINAVAFSANGARVLCQRGDGVIEAWDEAGDLLKAHRSERVIDSAAFSSDGRRVAFVEWDFVRHEHSVRLWDVQSGKVAGKTQGEFGMSGWDSFRVAFSPDGRSLYFYGGKALAVWEVETGARLTTLRGKVEERRVKEAAGGGQISVAGQDGARLAFDVETRGFAGGEFGADDLRVHSPDGRRLLTGVLDEDKSAILYWDVRKGKALPFDGRRAEAADALRISPDGKRLWASWECGPEHLAHGVWSLKSGKSFRGKYLRGACSDGAPEPVFREKKGRAAARRKVSVGKDGALRVRSARTGKLLATFVLGRKGDWLIVTPEGFFTGSPGGARLAHVAVGGRMYALGPLRPLYRPDLVARVLSKGRDRKYRAAARKLDLVRLVETGKGGAAAGLNVPGSRPGGR